MLPIFVGPTLRNSWSSDSQFSLFFRLLCNGKTVVTEPPVVPFCLSLFDWRNAVFFMFVLVVYFGYPSVSRSLFLRSRF